MLYTYVCQTRACPGTTEIRIKSQREFWTVPLKTSGIIKTYFKLQKKILRAILLISRQHVLYFFFAYLRLRSHASCFLCEMFLIAPTIFHLQEHGEGKVGMCVCAQVCVFAESLFLACSEDTYTHVHFSKCIIIVGYCSCPSYQPNRCVPRTVSHCTADSPEQDHVYSCSLSVYWVNEWLFQLWALSSDSRVLKYTPWRGCQKFKKFQCMRVTDFKTSLLSCNLHSKILPKFWEVGIIRVGSAYTLSWALFPRTPAGWRYSGA